MKPHGQPVMQPIQIYTVKGYIVWHRNIDYPLIGFDPWHRAGAQDRETTSHLIY